METTLTSSTLHEKALNDLNADREITKQHMSEDIYKMSEALCGIKDLSIEGQVIREDLLGLLEFEVDRLHQIDSLMIERRKADFSGRHFYSGLHEKHVLQ